MTTKTKRITQGCIYNTLLSCMESKVEPWVESRIIGKVIDSRRYDIMHSSQNTGNSFNSTGSAQQNDQSLIL